MAWSSIFHSLHGDAILSQDWRWTPWVERLAKQIILSVRIKADVVSGRTNELAAEYRLRTVSVAFPCFDHWPPLYPFNSSGVWIQTRLKHFYTRNISWSNIANAVNLQVQCLVNSDYTKSSTYTLETLLLYVQGEYQSRWDAEVGSG